AAAAPTSGADPSCGCNNACNSGCCKQKCCKPCLLDRLFSCHRCCKPKCGNGCHTGCGAPACGAPACAAPAPACAAPAPACGAEPACGIGGKAAPTAAGDDVPMPPAPVVDPSAFIPTQRRVVQASASLVR